MPGKVSRNSPNTAANRVHTLSKYFEWKTATKLERIQRVAALYLEGHSLKKIGEVVGLKYNQLRNYINEAKEFWKQSAAASYGQHVANEIARIALVETEAWEAWHKSKRDDRTISETTGKFAGTSKTKSRTNGDPRFLAVVQKCTEQRMKLLGLGVQPDDPNASQPKQIVEVVIHTRNEKEEFERIMPYSQFRQHQQPHVIDGQVLPADDQES